MNVGIDHAGKHRRRTEVDHRRARGNLQTGADVGNTIAFDQDYLIVEQVARFRVKHMSGPNGDDLIP